MHDAEHDESEDEMPARGVTRPPMGQHHADHARRDELAREHHRRTVWIPWTLILLGIWMMVTAVSVGDGTGAVEPAGGRVVWLDLRWRIAAMRWSDALSGAALVILGWRALTPGRHASRWAACMVGVWLQCAPLLLWAPTAAGYVNDTLVGVLVIALTILVPGMPGMIEMMEMGPDCPPGWSYNPSSWPQRSLMIALGFAGWMVSRALATYQLGYVDAIADPFFGDGSRRVLTSDVSRALPVSDAGLGALAYTFEFLMGWMGGRERWRTMPWMVTFFGILVIPLGLVHVVLVASQPIVVGQWCTLCLLAAAIMLPMIPLEADEVIAMLQFMRRARREGHGLWRTFWRGGIVAGTHPDQSQPPIHAVPTRPVEVLRASLRGMSCPWTLIAATLLGIGLMAAPGAVDGAGALADVEHALGASIVTLAVVAMGEPLRALRLLVVPVGVALVACSWTLPTSGAHVAIGVVAGLAAIVLALPRGPQREHYDAWDRWIR